VLAGAFFPMMFNVWQTYDDEGMFLVSLRELLNNHGSLYTTIWSDKYGPFYYLVMTTVYRVLHQQPTLENGRWIVLVLTTASAVLFAGAVWRVTKSVPCTLVCEVAAFVILIQAAGNEPMHPGSLAVLLVALVAFELASYAATRRTVHLIAIGGATGALMMTKLNSGGLVAVAVVAAFIIGNASVPRWLRIAGVALAALVPIALMLQNASANWVAVLAFVVVGSMLGMSVLMSIDQFSLPRSSFLSMAYGAAGVAVCSLIFPLLTGTALSDELTGVFIRPLSQAKQLTIPANVSVNFFALVLTAAGIYAAVAFRSLSKETIRAQATWTHATLAALALWLLGLGATVAARGGVLAEWLPALVVLPALAFCANSSEAIRFALRSLVLLAALQVLVAYPVAGSQVAWGTVAMTVPCAIALAAGIDHSRLWRESGVRAQVAVTLVLCIALVVAGNLWPLNVWNTYLSNTKMGLPGTGLMRIDPDIATEVQQVTLQLRQRCDTFYGVPDENSFYIFTGIAPFTGLLVDRPIALTIAQQQQVAAQLQDRSAANERVCILTDTSQATQLDPGPLEDALQPFSDVIATVDNYTIAIRP
jgi:hypothetical protein